MTKITSLWITSLLITAARADIPPPPDQKRSSTHIRLEGTESCAGYRFFVRCEAGPGNPTGSFRMKEAGKDPVMIADPSERLVNVILIAVPEASRLPEDPAQLDKVEGAITAPLSIYGRLLPVSDEATGVTYPCRVAMAGGALTVTVLPCETFAEGKQARPIEPEVQFPPLALPLGLLFSGLSAAFGVQRRRAHRELR